MPRKRKDPSLFIGDPVESWLFKAKNDLRAAKTLLKDSYTLDAAIYHTQQCAEKALKAYLAFRLQPIQKTHNIVFATSRTAPTNPPSPIG